MQTKELRKIDLFDLGAFFGSYVLVLARFHPLLKHASCVCAAKRIPSKRSEGHRWWRLLTAGEDERFEYPPVDWEWNEAYHDDRSIALLMEAIQQDQSESSPNSPDDMGVLGRLQKCWIKLRVMTMDQLESCRNSSIMVRCCCCCGMLPKIQIGSPQGDARR